MKMTTCKNLRGACSEVITGDTPEEMGENSRKHVMKMVQAGDQAHINAVESMKSLSQKEQQLWYESFKESFNSLPES